MPPRNRRLAAVQPTYATPDNTNGFWAQGGTHATEFWAAIWLSRLRLRGVHRGDRLQVIRPT